MKRSITTVVVLVLILALTLGAVAWAAGSWKLVVRVKGNVESKPIAEVGWTPILTSRPLGDTDEVRTLEDSEGKIMLSGGNVIRLFAKTRIQLAKIDETDTSRQTRVRQDSGRVEVRVARESGRRQTFEVETPSAVLAVRGSLFRSDVAPDGTTVGEAVEDTLYVTAQGKTIEIPPGFFSTINPGMVPGPIQPVPGTTGSAPATGPGGSFDQGAQTGAGGSTSAAPPTMLNPGATVTVPGAAGGAGGCGGPCMP